MPNKTFGTLRFDPDKKEWSIDAQPHVLIRLKQVFSKLAKRTGIAVLSHSPENCRELEWFLQRYPLECSQTDILLGGADAYRARAASLEAMVAPNYQPLKIPLELPPRDYQGVAIDLWRANRFLLLGDEMGLGKTPTVACALWHKEMRPAWIHCQAHLPKQWERELKKFLPDLNVHIIKKVTPYDLPPADAYICSYSKARGWGDYVTKGGFIKTVCHDEVQELRHPESFKYDACRAITEVAEWSIGLSGTPITNYGEEIYYVFDAIRPGCLGDYAEFQREWLQPAPGGKWMFKDPRAFGTYMRESFLGLARTRADVGRELPPLTKIPHVIEHDKKVLDGIKGEATKLALLLLEEKTSFTEKGQAAREFDLRVRQATGIAKAPYAAAFIRILIEAGKFPVCFAWHREVYRIMEKELADFKPAFFTGAESPTQKEKEVQRFLTGETPVIFLSTRSGAGLNGLQDRSDTTIHVELDWSGAIHDQNIWRVFREKSDGSFNNNVFSYFLLSDSGSDPVMAEILGIKDAQLSGLMRPEELEPKHLTEIDPERIKQMARAYLEKHHE